MWLFGKSPSFDKLEKPEVDVTSELYTADGKIIGRYYRENRTPIEYKKISPIIIKTLIATEDAHFYEHRGIDWSATASIFYYMFKGDRRGGSTITQQLAKNLFKTRKGSTQGLLGYIPGVKTFIYKLKEYVTALKLEMVYNKEQIITMYLNTVDFGYSCFGVNTATHTFFSTSPDSVNIQQAAILVGLLKATTTYSPILYPDNCIRRRNVVMSVMVRDHIITQQIYDSLKNTPLEIKLSLKNHYEGQGTYFRTAVENYVNKWCAEKGYDLYTDGLKIYTTVDSRLQAHAEAAVEETMREIQRRFFNHWKNENPWRDEKKNEIKGFIEDAICKSDIWKKLSDKYKGSEDSIWNEINRPKRMRVFTWEGEKDTTFSTYDSLKYYKHFLFAGFITLDPFKGHIKTWVGGINYKYFQYDHVIKSKRQPGSTFKPFVYLAAIDSFGYSPCDKLVDEPIEIAYTEDSAGVKINKVWRPRNSDWKITGQEMTLRWAMGKSVNTVTAQLINKIGWQAVIDYAHKLGIKSPLKNVPSVGLGSSDVSLYELVGAYGTFLNHGEYTEPIFVTKITDVAGKVLAKFEPASKRVISEESAFLMTYMLKGSLEEPGGTSQALFGFDLWRGNEFGGKTGTSSNHSDGWFVGLTKDLISASWVGAADRSVHFRTSAYGEGSKTALPIYGRFMEKVYRDKECGVKMGYFPKPRVRITKPYDCRTYLPKIDSTLLDSLFAPEVDSLDFGEEVTE
ncbi:MAG: transglycosylase domain-containing protein [Cytophagales bacterium]|nr:transglycosylase domain-containing protein [Cytophagales bacterium]